MLSQLGCVTLDPELIKMSFIGQRLSPEERARFAAHPKAAGNFLANIPRLDTVAWMISQQLIPDTMKGNLSTPAHPDEEIVLGAKILRLAVVLDSFRMKGLSEGGAIERLRDLRSEFNPELIDALADIEPETARMELRKVSTLDLSTGMILQQEIRTRTGMLVVPDGHELTQALIIKLENFSRAGTIDKEVMALVPV